MESNGPDVKVRGPASHIYERYLQLARDASSSGDRVMAESYLQHAEHYFRMLRAMQPAMPPQPALSDRFGAHEADYDGDEEGGDSAEGEAIAEAGGEASEGEFGGQGGQQQQDFSRDDGFRRRRGRRNRFRTGGPDGDREGGDEEGREASMRDEPREGGESEAQAEQAPRAPRARRAPRGEPRDGDERSGETPEGFSSGPRPAFLGSGAE